VIDISTIMNDSSLVTFVGEEIKFQEEKFGLCICKWKAFVDGKNGFLYGIPDNARRVAKLTQWTSPCRLSDLIWEEMDGIVVY
jgi:hypothetical protein